MRAEIDTPLRISDNDDPRPTKRLRLDCTSTISPAAPLAFVSKYIRESVASGKGAYGVVYKARLKHEEVYVAMKKFRDTEDDILIAKGEVDILKSLQHPRVIALLDVEQNQHLYLVFEWMTLDLSRYISMVRSISQEQVKAFMHQLLDGVSYCHSTGVVHRDLKPHNILVDAKGELKIADFGLARKISPATRSLTHEVATLWYRCPEILLGAPMYGFGVDMWSLGAIFAELVNLRPLWPGESEWDQLRRIFQSLGTPCEELWKGVIFLPEYEVWWPKWPKPRAEEMITGTLSPDGVDLLARMLTYSPASRIKAKPAFNHSYFA